MTYIVGAMCLDLQKPHACLPSAVQTSMLGPVLSHHMGLRGQVSVGETTGSHLSLFSTIHPSLLWPIIQKLLFFPK